MRACRPSERLTIFDVRLHLTEKRPITDTATSEGDIRHELAEVRRGHTEHEVALSSKISVILEQLRVQYVRSYP